MNFSTNLNELNAWGDVRELFNGYEVERMQVQCKGQFVCELCCSYSHDC